MMSAFAANVVLDAPLIEETRAADRSKDIEDSADPFATPRIVPVPDSERDALPPMPPFPRMDAAAAMEIWEVLLIFPVAWIVAVHVVVIEAAPLSLAMARMDPFPSIVRSEAPLAPIFPCMKDDGNMEIEDDPLISPRPLMLDVGVKEMDEDALGSRDTRHSNAIEDCALAFAVPRIVDDAE